MSDTATPGYTTEVSKIRQTSIERHTFNTREIQLTAIKKSKPLYTKVEITPNKVWISVKMHRF